ncbi:Dihydroorotate dehydrogenase B (NAD(+)), catalytic subunit [Desulfamplus magnetovallimortis]|uniref:Dihydroorotate dehydrogenase n=1 Tax=Desulfamplus magnetovallimortis TaxID=1246637 RepID=A0A1W1HE18_9BACT|nr:dihydroorotate dehydrogenase [Desulfamplus magnetovallimortis]SLM30744.1 Dihydroorotate dehydrogenase B (NAD(+)), catalytic subunit [Desulfamplus magnetovallimortis]
MKLDVKIGDIKLANPVMTASGTFGYAAEYKELLNFDRIGGIIVKGLSLEPSTGNPLPRVVETPCGLLNAVGLENVGLKAFIRDKLPFLQTLKSPVFVNIYGKKVEEYGELASAINSLDGIAGVEVNISCPNVSAGGAAFGVDPDAASLVVDQVRKCTSKHVMVKLSPNVTDIVRIAQAVEDAGADSVSLINTLTGLAIDSETFSPMLANVTGGLSGPAIKPVALRMVWQVASNVKIPVIGIGGIATATDAIEFIIAGATAVQVGTAMLVDPDCHGRIVSGLRAFLKRKKFESINDIRGRLIV